jgi:hypothetical protein
MIDMRAWKVGTVDVVSGLDLDPLNVRLEIPTGAPEADIMLDLFKNEKALDLVEAIVKVGYLTHEVPIVVKRGARVVVVEGNRRLAALKAIQNPYLVSEYQARISALVGGVDQTLRDSFRKIEVKFAPSQSDADQLIAALHTSNPRVAWSPTRQAAFFQAQIDAGQSLAQLRTNYPTVDVEKYVLRSAILKKFQAVSYSTPELSDFVRDRAFSVSTLARIYESKSFIELVGLALNTKGVLQCKLSAAKFAAVAEAIVHGMHTGDLTTRSVNSVKSPRFKALMDELQQIVAGSAGTSTSSPGTPSPGSTAGQPTTASPSPGTGSGAGTQSGAGQPSSPPTGSGAGPSKAKPKQTPTLDVSSISVPTAFPPSIDRIFQELSTLSVEKYPNATLDLLRTALEKSIKAFAEVNGIDIRQSGKNQQGYVYLKQCLEWLEDWIKSHGPKAQRQVVQKLQSSKISMVGYAVSKSHLDAINHNHHIFATGDEVRDSWDAMQSLFSQVMFK